MAVFIGQLNLKVMQATILEFHILPVTRDYIFLQMVILILVIMPELRITSNGALLLVNLICFMETPLRDILMQ
jgi:adenine deaminase